MSKPKRPQRLSRSTIYESEWISLHADKVEYPDGRIIEKLHVLDYPKEAVGVIVVDDRGKILLEYAYRYHTGVDGWEIPAGGIDGSESIIEAAERETLEETGYKSKDHEVMYTYNPSNGSSNQVFHIVVCKAFGEQGKFDKNEVRETKWFTIAEVKEMVREKGIVDGYTLSALLLHFSD